MVKEWGTVLEITSLMNIKVAVPLTNVRLLPMLNGSLSAYVRILFRDDKGEKENMKWRDIFLIALWGGGASIVTSSLVTLWSKLITNPPLVLAGFVSIMVFLVVGLGVTVSLRKILISDKKSRDKLLLAGLTGSALYGLFSPFGVIGYHLAVFLFPVGVALFIRKGLKFSTFFGGIIGGLFGVFMSTIGTITFFKYFSDLVQNDLVPHFILFYTGFVTIYFLNLGMLISIAKVKNKMKVIAVQNTLNS